ncbi:MAG TPA: hypothetical protein VG777_02715 [Thermoanaerobaculia bacterium]|nr:hypothetical protein [Thermoanaerobaculia bacterium]
MRQRSAMPALTGQCRRCLRFGELYPVRGVYYCRVCGDVFEKHLRGYRGPERRVGDSPSPSAGEPNRRRWSDAPSGTPDIFAATRSLG